MEEEEDEALFNVGYVYKKTCKLQYDCDIYGSYSIHIIRKL